MPTSKPPYLTLLPPAPQEEPEPEMLRVFGFPETDENGELSGECCESMWVEVVPLPTGTTGILTHNGQKWGMGVLKNHPVLSTLSWGDIVEYRYALYPDEPGEQGAIVPVFQGVYKSAES